MATNIPADCLYAENHEWIRVAGDTARVGISDHAQDELTDVVYVELPEVGDSFAQGAPFAVVESVKAASDVFLPVAGEIIAINEDLADTPEAVNEEPYGKGWFVEIRISNPDELSSLMTPEAYAAYLETLG
ncbi:MAG: glycine cleavage system protein GcvH [Anaerolineae bacterium]|jgi:glycine cleavage system H protein|nr:glycine cleavage system protein GcvH [Chloroflexota bacterium]